MKKVHLHKCSARGPIVSIVIPVFNEQEVLEEFHGRLFSVLDKLQKYELEIIYVNDGSQDKTLPLLLKLIASDDRFQVLDLSRNFGKEAAMTAGIDHANGDAVILLDADLQDPPELIPKMIASWNQGFDMVCMQRTSRAGESFLKKFTARAFYTLMGRVGGIQVPENVGDFRLMSRSVVDALKCLPERTRFMKGLFAWVGFKTCILPYHRDARYAGTSKWNYWRLWNFALDGFTSFTVAPLKIASYTGFMTALTALGYAVFVMSKALIYGDPVPGYPSLMVVVLFLGGLQLLALGVIGEYLGRMFIESKQRPLYLLKSQHQGTNDHSDSVSTISHFPIVKEILNQ